MAWELKEFTEQEAASNYHLIHQDSTGIICMSTAQDGTWKNEYGRYKAINKKFCELESLDNVFFSQNTFKKFKKSGEHLFELKALYLDIDYYRTGYTLEQVLYAIEQMVSEHIIPPPTQIVDSGHGLYVTWRIKRLPACAIKLWRMVEDYLYLQFKNMGADRKSLEPTRVMRFAGSLNAKYPEKKMVHVLSTYPVEYDIHHLQYEYLEYPSPKTRRTKQREREKGKIVLFKKNIYTLYCNRREDILSLCKIRNFEMTGIREMTLFLYRYYSCLTVTDPQAALEMMLELNDQFTEPCAHSTVRRATRSAERAAAEERYNYRSSTLVEILHITEEEMMLQYNNSEDYILKTIITKEIKYKRKNINRNAARRNDLGQTKTEINREDNLKLVQELYELGLTQQKIADEMDLSLRMVQNYCKELKEQGLISSRKKKKRR